MNYCYRLGLVGLVLLIAGAGAPVRAAAPATKTPIEHFIVVMQENHTFDNYFGTYPGADGFPAGVCMPVDPAHPEGECVQPFPIGERRITDLDHSAETFELQYNHGKMDGFVHALNIRQQEGDLSLGYYDRNDLPYHWALADNYVLFDRFFSSARGGSFTNHIYWVAAGYGDERKRPEGFGVELQTIFDRLEAEGISWKFYVQNYDPNITYRTAHLYGSRSAQVIWVPLLNIHRFLDDPQLASHIVDLEEYYKDLQNGTLPAVAYIAPSGASEHPPSSLMSGQRFIKSLIQALMQSSAWESSAFLLTYDDWGGWYDHVQPPQVDEHGYGFRVPAILVSAYARRGYIDSTELDFTSCIKFIEENWDIAPLNDRSAQANNFLSAFDFSQPPRPPVLIPLMGVTPKTGPAESARSVIYLAYGIGLLFAGGLIGWAAWVGRVRTASVPPREEFDL